MIPRARRPAPLLQISDGSAAPLSRQSPESVIKAAPQIDCFGHSTSEGETPMRTIKRQFASVVLIVAALSPSISVSAQGSGAPQTTGNWSAVSSVPTGDRLIVKLKSGQTVEGKFSAVSDSSLSLSVKGKPVDVKRDEVFSIYHVTKKSTTKATLIGMGVGAGAGAAIGLAGSSSGDSFDKLDHAVTAGLAVLGAGAGAAIGYFIGRSGRKRVLIYQGP